MQLHTLLRHTSTAVLGFAACAAFSSVQAATSTLTVGAPTWIGCSPYYVAAALDLYKKHDLKVVWKTFTDPAAMPAALSGGSLDAALVTYDQVIGAAGQGQSYKVVLPVDYSNGGDAILAAKPIAKVSELKGKKVAYAPLSPSDFLLAYALKVNGLSVKDISHVNMAPEAVPAAMASGAVPVGVTYEPSISQIMASGKDKFQVIYSSKEAPGLIADVIAVDAKKLSKNSKAIQALAASYADAMAYMKAKPAESAKLIGKAMGISDKEAMEQLTGVYNIPPNEMAKSFAKSAETTSYYASGAIINEILVANKQIKKPVDIASTLDDRFVKAMAK